MYLKRLEMYGFKSFADKTVLEFKDGITTVIGPNGSGKSNISDCIRWVLGEQSIKSLRGSKSEDIIFSGTQNRKAIGYAEGSLVFDNSDGKLPIEFNEVTVTRRIYRSGETGYFINKAPCRLKDISELFMDTGIGKDGYSIIGQGKIDEILSNKSEDRRRIFEEAAGIVKYRTRKEESEKKLEQTKLNLLRINDIIAEIEGNLDPLKEQSEKARKYLNLREELKSIEVGLFLKNIENSKEKATEIDSNLDVFETQKVKEDEKMANLQIKKEELRGRVNALIDQIEESQNLGFEGNQRKEQLYSKIKINNERIANNEVNCDRYKEDIEELKQKNKDLEDEKNQKLSKKDDLFSNKDKYVKQLEEKEAELAKYSKTLSDKELEIEGKKKVLDANIDKRYEIAIEQSTEAVNLENLDKNEKSIKNELSDLISELDKTRENKSSLEKAFYEIEKERHSLEKEMSSMKEEKDKSDEKINGFDETINTLETDYRVKSSKLKFLEDMEREKEGYNKSVKSILVAAENNSSLKKGMHGVLANLINTDKEYETAIEMTLGSTIQNIVTDTEEEAKTLVKFLRDNNLGRASFLPISSVKGSKLSHFSSTNGVIGIASDLVKYDKKYEGVILDLLGRTVVVDDIDNAVALAKKNKYSFKIVTLKGDIINPSGAISGGSVYKKQDSILGRGKEIESLKKDIKVLEEKIEKAKKDKEDYIEEIKSILEKFEVSQKKMQEQEIVYATEKQKIDNVGLEILKLEAKRDKLKEDIENIVKQRNDIKAHQEELEKDIKAIDEENSSLSSIIEEFSNLNKDNQKYIDDLNLDITNLKISVTSFDESENSINEMMERIDQDIANNEKSIANKEESINGFVKENETLLENNKEVEEEIKKLEEDILGSSEKVEKLKAERQEKNEELDGIEEEINSQNDRVNDLINQISKLDVKKQKIQMELDQIINKLWEEYELTVNNVGEYKPCENISSVQKEVNSLRNKIKDLGSINVDSIEEYNKLKERYDFMSEQRLDLEDSSAKLNKVIQEMLDTMTKQFSEQFKIINKNFSKVFVELFGGGKAELKLTDEDNVLECGIDIEVQPPGKKLQNMLLLSGGEKAFSAIALLFAILKINPAPFCVLDEIEAALDDVNVYRFADYLKKYTDKTQFLVITHRKGTMEAADTIYGITMEEKGISKLLSMKLK